MLKKSKESLGRRIKNGLSKSLLATVVAAQMIGGVSAAKAGGFLDGVSHDAALPSAGAPLSSGQYHHVGAFVIVGDDNNPCYYDFDTQMADKAEACRQLAPLFLRIEEDFRKVKNGERMKVEEVGADGQPRLVERLVVDPNAIEHTERAIKGLQTANIFEYPRALGRLMHQIAQSDPSDMSGKTLSTLGIFCCQAAYDAATNMAGLYDIYGSDPAYHFTNKNTGEKTFEPIHELSQERLREEQNSPVTVTSARGSTFTPPGSSRTVTDSVELRESILHQSVEVAAWNLNFKLVNAALEGKIQPCTTPDSQREKGLRMQLYGANGTGVAPRSLAQGVYGEPRTEEISGREGVYGNPERRNHSPVEAGMPPPQGAATALSKTIGQLNCYRTLTFRPEASRVLTSIDLQATSNLEPALQCGVKYNETPGHYEDLKRQLNQTTKKTEGIIGAIAQQSLQRAQQNQQGMDGPGGR